MICHAGLAALCHEHHIPLIVDEAHGGHFAFAEQFPQVRACVGLFCQSRAFFDPLLPRKQRIANIACHNSHFLYSLLWVRAQT